MKNKGTGLFSEKILFGDGDGETFGGVDGEIAGMARPGVENVATPRGRIWHASRGSQLPYPPAPLGHTAVGILVAVKCYASLAV